ncbi:MULTISPECIES: ABC transporter family substrate-binding protein [Streptomyces]|uniref:ABC transporter family substrate-binding protein n=1 Tax=Streptomyces koelreuteriae TaxID=2838015 RepID=A0ABX8FQF9_9ACTN|nr:MULTISPECIES: ABC transporter family substrate-binding protein [Streptomyces]QWB23274.1 ABC transporter family substrate-binding protein [Streptomyces koelreuteriae]UUA06226.1 ABC transporter family substrate-binding protein [Streptomyces koelreuteriae]UUA13853.1 ABC transporter family substrate-binding protein [Streptomyces sp. CRCS-T-1]
MSQHAVGPRAVSRSVAFLLTAGVLAVPALAGCGSEDPAGKPLAGQDIQPAPRDRITDGGTLRWAVDSVPDTLNTFQSDADATTTRVAQAVLPSMFRMNADGRPERNPAYLESAKVVETEPKQVVLYKLDQQAVWSDGREIGAADFAAQWRALSGKDTAYWTARNAGYDRIQKIERGDNALEVRVTFSRTYADWRSLFSPLYPKDVMGTPDSFNDGARKKLKVTAGPFTVKKLSRKNEEITLTRNPRWWGRPAKLSEIVLRTVPREKRAKELAAGTLDLAEIAPSEARRITVAARPRGSSSPVMGPEADQKPQGSQAAAKYARQQQALRGFEVRKSLEPAFTQLALNGAEGPLADERVRRAVARALDRKELAEAVLKPLGLPAVPVGSHLALSGQAAYADNSGALGGQDTKEAQALLADAGWVRGGPIKEEKKKGEKAAGAEGEKAGKSSDGDSGNDDGEYIVGSDDKDQQDKKDQRNDNDQQDGKAHRENDPAHLAQDGKQYKQPHQGGAPGAYAPMGTAAPAGRESAPLAKNGKPLTLRFVLPSGPGSQTLRTVADRVARMLKRVGIGTEISKVSDESYFKDHIASGQYDLALYSWPASAFPATDARPVYAKPVPAADGSLNVEQNYTRVGTDQVDQLFDQAVATLDEGESRSLIRKADSRIWAAAGSIPLFQRPQLIAARKNLVNIGAFGLGTPVYEDMGFLKKGAKPASGPSAKGSATP